LHFNLLLYGWESCRRTHFVQTLKSGCLACGLRSSPPRRAMGSWAYGLKTSRVKAKTPEETAPSTMSDWKPEYEKTVAYIKSKLPAELQTVQIGVICGSGLGGLEATADEGVKVKIDYKVCFNHKDSIGMNGPFVAEG
jgi:hypothetical protein